MEVRSRKILPEEQINWFYQQQTTLNYRMLFEPEEEEIDSSLPESPKTAEEELSELRLELEKREQEWKAELEQVSKEAFDKGFEEGVVAGNKEATRQIDEKISKLEEWFEAAHAEWRQRQKILDPGLLDLSFNIAESILCIPIENPEIRRRMDAELKKILPRLDEQSKPVLLVSESDFGHVRDLKEKYATQIPVSIRVSEECNPGEFELETDRETVVLRFKELLAKFKSSVALPGWK